jgi:hypothetical protein
VKTAGRWLTDRSALAFRMGNRPSGSLTASLTIPISRRGRAGTIRLAQAGQRGCGLRWRPQSRDHYISGKADMKAWFSANALAILALVVSIAALFKERLSTSGVRPPTAFTSTGGAGRPAHDHCDNSGHRSGDRRIRSQRSALLVCSVAP